MQHLHDAGVLHRDLKPANILLSSDRLDFGREPDSDDTLPLLNSTLIPKIVDFGLAKRLDAEGITQTGDFLGTPNFTAPEQAAGLSGIGPPADIHALGAILYQLLAGRPPFAGANVLETLDQVRFNPPVPPSRLRPNLPRDLETICLHCLQKDPARRYPRAAALADDLDRYLDGKPIKARPVRTAERLGMWARRHPAIAGLSAAMATLIIATLIAVTTLWRKAAEARDSEGQERQRAENRSAELLLTNARLSWIGGDFIAARNALTEVPEDFRGPDWRYLSRACAPPLFDTGISDDWIMRVAFSHDGKYLAALTNTGAVRVWEVASGKETVKFDRHFTPGIDMAFSFDGRLAVAHYETKPPVDGVPKGLTHLTFLDPASGKVVHEWTWPERARVFDVSPGVQTVAFVSFENSTILLLDGPTGKVRHRIGGFSIAGSPYISFCPNGTMFAAQGFKQDVVVYDPVTGTELRRMKMTEEDKDLVAMSLHPDGSRFGMRSARPKTKSKIVVRGVGPAVQPVTTPTYFGTLLVLLFSPDGRLMLGLGSSEHFASLWDADTGREYLELRGHNDRLSAFAFSPDSKSLAIGCFNGRVVIWDIRATDREDAVSP